MTREQTKRVKPSNQLRATTREASDEDYAKLAQHIVSALANKCRDLVIRFPYFVKLPDDWPRGILIKRDDKYNWYRVKVFKAADWLNKHGYLPEDAKGIIKSMRSVNNMMGEVDRLLASPQEEFLKNDKIFVDKIYGGAYNDKPVDKEDV
jgi:hypothetical protein